MGTSSPEPDDDPFGLVEKYDSIDDPDLRSDFLDAIGTTLPYINALRLRRDRAAREDSPAPTGPDRAVAEAPGPPDDKGPRRRSPRLPIRSRATTHPPRYASYVLNRRRRNRGRPGIVVIIFKLD